MAYGGITQMLPASIIELNMKVATDSEQSMMLKRQTDTDFADIPIEPRKLKREISLPGGIENWNIDNFDPYLADIIEPETDGIVPEGERVRCSSISSASSFNDNIRPVRNCTVKTISTVRMDSGSTCISSDYIYESAKQKCKDWLDPEETYQNLDCFLQEVPEITASTDSLSSVSAPLPSSSSSDNAIMEFPSFHNYSSLSSTVFNSLAEKTSSGSIKRRLDSNSEDEVFIAKQTKQEYKVEECRYVEIRRKNNLASKNCRKTRKEKQREMEQRVTELEREKETLSVQIQVLEELIQAHKACLLNAIVQRR